MPAGPAGKGSLHASRRGLHGQDALGVGAGAHGKITTDSGVVRTVKRANPREYLQSMIESREPGPGTVLTAERRSGLKKVRTSVLGGLSL